MPIYEYACNTCGKEFEVMQKFSAKPLTKCTCSDKGRVHRKLSAPSFHLQGGGWYNEGYSAKKVDNGNGAGAKGESGKTDAKSDAKPEAKSEAKSGTSESSSSAKADSTGSAKAEKKESKKSPASPAPA